MKKPSSMNIKANTVYSRCCNKEAVRQMQSVETCKKGEYACIYGYWKCSECGKKCDMWTPVYFSNESFNNPII